MYAYIVQQANSVGEPRRQRVAVGSMREARGGVARRRQALGVALVALGQRIAGEMPASQAPQPDGDCA